MSIVSRRTVGQILLAYDDGTSPPTETTPLGSIVSVADGTLWVSLGGGTYTQASGGGPLGDSTIWPPVIDWPDLVNVAGPLRDGDRVFVGELNVLGSFGFAEYDAGIPQWRLTKGTFPTVTDMQTFGSGGEGIAPGALASIGTGAVPEPTYFYDVGFTQWVRTPDGGVGYIWQSANDWADLLSIPTDNLMASDLRSVISLGFGAAYGTAIWNGSNWDLFLGFFESVADMNAFAVTNSIFYAALASVYPGAVNSELSVRFFWDGGQWVRTPDGIHYVWGQVPNWAALSTIIAPKNNDEVHVQTLGTTHSSGTAQRHGGTWALIEGKWISVAQMNAWAGGAIHSGAIAFIDPTHQYDEDSTVYYYTGGAWVQTGPSGVPSVYTITSIYDFSASGLADGDYGVLTPSGGSPIVLRYKAACLIAAGGFRAVWMTPTAYAGTPVLQAWTDGTENNGTLASQGWTISLGTGCTIVPTGGYQRMNAPGVNPISASLTAMSGAIAAATKVESIYECRATLPNGTACRAKQLYLTDGTNGYSIGDSGQGGATGYGYRQSGTGAIANTPIRDVTNVRIPALAAAPFVCVARDEGRTVFTSVSVNGNAFADYRRNLGTIGGTSLIYVYVTCDAFGAAVTMDYRGQILTY